MASENEDAPTPEVTEPAAPEAPAKRVTPRRKAVAEAVEEAMAQAFPERGTEVPSGREGIRRVDY